MSKSLPSLRLKLTYANVMSTIAVLAVLTTGVSFAHHAPNNTGTRALRDGAVTTPKLANRAVGPAKMKPRTVRTRHLAPDIQGVAAAGVVFSADGEVVSWFNRVGGEPRVEEAGVGAYVVTIAGLGEIPGIVQVVATLQSPEPGMVTHQASPDGSIEVFTWDPEGRPAQLERAQMSVFLLKTLEGSGF